MNNLSSVRRSRAPIPADAGFMTSRRPTFLTHSLAMLAGTAASCLVAPPASAQFFGGYYNAPPSPYGYGGYGYARPLPPDEIVDRIEDQGFEDVRRVRQEGSVYVAEATSEGGIRTRVTVDAYRGRVIDRRPALAGYPGGPRAGSPYEEMSESEMRRRGIMPGPTPGGLGPNVRAAPFREAARPYAPAPVAPLSPVETVPGAALPGGALPAPADRRLAPSGASREETPRREPKREAARSSGEVDGVNPDARSSRTTPRPNGGSAARTAPTTRTSPPAPAPAVQPSPAAEPISPAEAANRPAKPVRVIGGVTQMSEPATGQRGAPPANQSETPATPPVAPN